jgi:hypothetical protein
MRCSKEKSRIGVDAAEVIPRKNIYGRLPADACSR